MRRNAKDIIFCSLLLLLTTELFAQKYQVRIDAAFDTTAIRIGEHFHMDLELMLPADAKPFFPDIKDSIGKLDVVEKTPVDTVKSEDGTSTTYRQRLTLTAFDAGSYYLQPSYFYYKLKGSDNIDSVATPMLTLQVQTVAVDTNKAIKEIKPPMGVPVVFEEVLPYLIGGLAAILIIWLIVRYYRNKKRNSGPVVEPVPLRPAHETALEALRNTDARKLWQEGQYKLYHSEVTDIVRLYIEQRFAIPAMELTSDETLKHFKNKLLTNDAYEKLEYILLLADTVKFAKAIPLATENEKAMADALAFIMQTKTSNSEPILNSKQNDSKEAGL